MLAANAEVDGTCAPPVPRTTYIQQAIKTGWSGQGPMTQGEGACWGSMRRLTGTNMRPSCGNDYQRSRSHHEERAMDFFSKSEIEKWLDHLVLYSTLTSVFKQNVFTLGLKRCKIAATSDFMTRFIWNRLVPLMNRESKGNRYLNQPRVKNLQVTFVMTSKAIW